MKNEEEDAGRTEPIPARSGSEVFFAKNSLFLTCEGGDKVKWSTPLTVQTFQSAHTDGLKLPVNPGLAEPQ